MPAIDYNTSPDQVGLVFAADRAQQEYMPTLIRAMFLALALLGGCTSMAKQEPSSAPEDHGALGEEVQALFAQQYIDPLTSYLEEHKGDTARAKELAAIRQERDKRCNAIAQSYSKRDRTEDNLATIRKGYQYSCPRVVDEFAAVVEKAGKGDVPVAPDGSLESAAGVTKADPITGHISQGTASAQAALDNCYLLFKIKNYREATDACRKPAEQGDARAQYNLAVIARALEVYPESLKWTRLAVAQNLPEGQYHLGLLYFHGQGVTQDYATALRWYETAGTAGFPEAQYSAGQMYLAGTGIQRDAASAAKWFSRAAEQGHADAQTEIGNMYVRGEGVAPNGDTARKWLTMAAEQGSTEAQYNLGSLYANGIGTAPNHAEAYVWLSLAVAGGNDKAVTMRDASAQKLSAAQLAEAEQRVRKALEN